VKSISSDQASHRTLVTLLTVTGAAIGLLHLLAAFFPSSYTWGFHQLAFFPSGVKIALPLLMLCLLLPAVQTALLDGAERIIALPRSLKVLLAALGTAGCVLLFWWMREKLLLLGDGYLLVRTIPHIHGAGDTFFPRNEPIPAYLSWMIWRLLEARHVSGGEELAPRILSIVSGAASLPVVVLLARCLAEEPIDRLLVGSFVAVWGGAQLFFGYVENYAFLALVVLAFVWLAVSSLRGGFSPLLPSIAYGLLFTVHFGMVCILPVMGLLWHRSFRQGRRMTVFWSIISAVATAVLLLWMCGYTPQIFFDMFFKSGTHLLALSGGNETQAYGLLSLGHVADLLNLEMLLAPFCGVTLIVLLVVERRRIDFRDGVLVALLIGAGCGVLFTVVVNPELGMSRDWDLLASFSLPLAPAAAYLAVRCVRQRLVRRKLFVMMAGVTLVCTAGWIILNASGSESLARFQELPDDRLWGKHALKSAYEELAILYRGRMDAEKSISNYSKYLAVDSTNPRIYASIANIYRLRGDSGNEMRYDEMAIRKGATYWDVFSGLAMLYASRGRAREGLMTALQGYMLNPRSAGAAVTAGVLLAKRDGNCQEALGYYRRALELDSLNTEAWYEAGMCCRSLGNVPGMIQHLGQFLRLAPPEDPRAADVRSLLLEYTGVR
jgi:hypothetical protein